MTFVFMVELAMREMDRPFEPEYMAKVMDLVARFIERSTRNEDLREAFVRGVVDDLALVDAWISQQEPPSEVRERRTLLDAVANGVPVAPEVMVQVLHLTALELRRVDRLIKLRMGRMDDHD